MKPLTKKQLQARIKRLERKNRQLRVALHESVGIAINLSRMIPLPNYNFAEGM